MERKSLEGKKAVFFLKNNRKYTCKIVSVDEFGFSCVDKFGKHIYIPKDSIVCIEEEENE